MDATLLPNVVIRTEEAPSLCLEEDGSWSLLFGDAGVIVLMGAAAVRTMNADYLSQQLGGPFEDD
jgi:hypothetical protein